MAAGKPTKQPKLNFRLELKCDCKPPICAHAGPGIAKLLEGAYAKGRLDGMKSAIGGVSKVAAAAGIKLEVKVGTVGVRQAGSKRTQ